MIDPDMLMARVVAATMAEVLKDEIQKGGNSVSAYETAAAMAWSAAGAVANVGVELGMLDPKLVSEPT